MAITESVEYSGDCIQCRQLWRSFDRTNVEFLKLVKKKHADERDLNGQWESTLRGVSEERQRAKSSVLLHVSQCAAQAPKEDDGQTEWMKECAGMDNNRPGSLSQNECTAAAEPRLMQEEGNADTAAPLTPNPEISPEDAGGGRALKDIERAYISRVFAETNHNLARAARILEIDRSTLYSKLKKYGLK